MATHSMATAGLRTATTLRCHRYALTCLAFAFILAVCAPAAHACRIPVFRYALERWAPDPFQAIIVHSEPLSAEQQALVERLRTRAETGDDRVNLAVITVPLADQQDQGSAQSESPENVTSPPAVMLTPDEKRLVDEATSPMILLRFPPSSGVPIAPWSAPLTDANVSRLLDSPLRMQVVEQLLQGASAVWILVECGDPARDDAAAATLEQELERMEKVITLPALEELANEEEFLANTTVPLRLSFSLVRLPRDAADEDVFRSMLLASEPDLVTFDEPIAIPVYGRGRTYFALVGKGINAATIESNSRFVCGDCSCQIKEDNPGVDLLLAANWEAKVQGPSLLDRDLPEVSGIGSLDLIDLGTVESMSQSRSAELSGSTDDGDRQSNAPALASRTPSEDNQRESTSSAVPGANQRVPTAVRTQTSAAPVVQRSFMLPFGLTGLLLICVLVVGLAVGVASVVVLGRNRES